MSPLKKVPKSRKKQSEFEKLWQKAEKLRARNERFKQRLDAVAQRVAREVYPAERAAVADHLPLLHRLLILGQRKSMTQWERATLDEWIHELLDPMPAEILNESEVLEEFARFQAFRMGVELDDGADAPPPSEQVTELINKAKTSFDPEAEYRESVLEEIEEILDSKFGPPPPHPDQVKVDVDDFFQDEIKTAAEKRYREYHEKRDAERERLQREMLDGGPSDDKEDDDFDDFWEDLGSLELEQDEDDLPEVTRDTFNRLFRSTAARLHPDREHDPERREEKQALMARLLAARKSGDVMTVIELYQQHVATDDDGLSGADEKQLIAVLQRQIDQLEDEKDEYPYSSPGLVVAFEHFYDTSQKKIDQHFKRYLAEVAERAEQAKRLAREITSLKTLKPHLDQRYREAELTTLEVMLEKLRRGGGVFY